MSNLAKDLKIAIYKNKLPLFSIMNINGSEYAVPVNKGVVYRVLSALERDAEVPVEITEERYLFGTSTTGEVSEVPAKATRAKKTTQVSADEEVTAANDTESTSETESEAA